jgi:predicted nucleic acid-binding protein
VIVVDSDIIAYYWINGPLTRAAWQVWTKDPDWHVPLLGRSEMRSILTGYLRDGSLAARQIGQVMAAGEAAFSGREHLVSSERVLKIVEETRVSAHDAEFVALAEVLAVPLVTADKAVLKAFPARARTMQTFAQERDPGGAA